MKKAVSKGSDVLVRIGERLRMTAVEILGFAEEEGFAGASVAKARCKAPRIRL